MTTKYGFFSELPHIPQTKLASKDAGKSGESKAAFKPAFGGRVGKLDDAAFDKFLSLHTGDRYQDSSTRLAAQKSAKEGGEVAKSEGRVFKPSGPGKEAAGLHTGDHFATFSAKTEHIPDPGRKTKAMEKPLQGRPIYTNPSKKGSYGSTMTTLSQRKGFQGVAGEYAYQADPYLDTRLHRKQDTSKNASTTPFKFSSAHRTSCFSQFENIAVGEPKKSVQLHTGPPFRPPLANSGQDFNPPAEHLPDPYPKTLTKEEVAKQKKYAAFKPTFRHRTTYTPSVMRMNLQYTNF